MLDPELPYRIAVGGTWIIGYAVRLYYERRARGVQRVSARHLTRDRIFYWLVFTAFVLALVYAFTPFLDAAQLPLPAIVRWLGLPFAVLGVALLRATHHALGRNWSGKLEIAAEHRLIVAGPYRRVRHPMYTAFLLFAVGSLTGGITSRVGSPQTQIELAREIAKEEGEISQLRRRREVAVREGRSPQPIDTQNEAKTYEIGVLRGMPRDIAQTGSTVNLVFGHDWLSATIERAGKNPELLFYKI